MSNKVIILTGDIQTGKTTLLQQFCLEQKNVAGILTPIINGKRVFYNIQEKSLFEMEADAEEGKLVIGKYLFSAAAFIKANTIMTSAATRPGLKYLIIDEIGPLEVRQQKGLYASFITILQSVFDYTFIIVVRKSLVDEVIKTFNLSNAAVMNISVMEDYFRSRL